MKENVYTVPLAKVYRYKHTQRARKAIKFLRMFIGRHMKVPEVWLSMKVNELIWARSIQKPPRKLRVKAIAGEDGIARVYLPDEKTEEQKKVEKEEKAKKAAKPTETKETEKAEKKVDKPKEEKKIEVKEEKKSEEKK